jgi:hypothetical protein
MARGLAFFVASRLDLERRQLAFPRNMLKRGRSLRESPLRMGLS